MDLIENMPRDWWTEEIDLTIDRLGLMTLLGILDLALRHPKMPETTLNNGKQIGRQILTRMLEDGLKLPEDVEAVYRETFDMVMQEALDEKDRG